MTPFTGKDKDVTTSQIQFISSQSRAHTWLKVPCETSYTNVCFSILNIDIKNKKFFFNVTFENNSHHILSIKVVVKTKWNSIFSNFLQHDSKHHIISRNIVIYTIIYWFQFSYARKVSLIVWEEIKFVKMAHMQNCWDKISWQFKHHRK